MGIGIGRAASALLMVSVWLGGSAGEVVAQPPEPAKTEEEARAAYEAHQADFDYLLGDWEFVRTRHSPDGTKNEARGYWSARRSADGAIITDEYRLLAPDGSTQYVSTTVRAYSAAERRWNLIGVEPGQGYMQPGIAWKEGEDMRVDQTFGRPPDTTEWRIRYHNIRPDAFSWRADVSRDGGRTWVEGYQTLEARRIAPAPAPASLTPRGK